MKTIKFVKYFLLILMTSTILYCHPTKNRSTEWNTLKYKADFVDGSNMIKKEYCIRVPKGGKVLKETSLFTGDFHTEWRILYPDSSIFYINNNEWSGSVLNYPNRLKIGISGYTKKHLSDTLIHSGSVNGLSWKECVIGDIVLGYVEASSSRKEQFDFSIEEFINTKGKCKNR